MKLGELFYELGFKEDVTKLNDFIGMVGNLDTKAIFAAAGLGALYTATKKIMTVSSDTAMEMRNFTVETGLSAQKMKSWSNAAESVGVAGNTVEETLKHIQMVQAKFKMNQPDEGFIQGIYLLNEYGKAGIDIYDDVFLMQEKIVKGLDKMDASQKRNVLSLMGINEQMLRFYTDQAAFNERNKRQVANTQEVEKLVAFWKELKELGQNFLTILIEIGAKLSTIFTPIINFMNKFLEFIAKVENKKEILAMLGFGASAATGNIPGMVASGSVIAHSRFTEKEKFGGIIKDIISAFSNINLMNVPLMGMMGAGGNNKTQNVNATFNINGDDPTVLKNMTADALNDVIGNSWNKLRPDSY